MKTISRQAFARAVGGALALSALAGCTQMTARTPQSSVLTGRCADVDFPVYFEEGSDRLTAPARQVLGSATARARGCRLASGEIVGLAAADAPSRAVADALSQQRAQSVARALAEAGLPGPALQLRAAGAQGARAPGGRASPMRHAAQVFLHFARA